MSETNEPTPPESEAEPSGLASAGMAMVMAKQSERKVASAKMKLDMAVESFAEKAGAMSVLRQQHDAAPEAIYAAATALRSAEAEIGNMLKIYTDAWIELAKKEGRL